MSISGLTNTTVSRGVNQLNKLHNQLDTTMQRLSSGKRINSAKDDAAGLQIYDRLMAQLNGLNQGNRNANDGIALAQTMEGALSGTTDSLQRMRELAIQAANGTMTADDRAAIQSEMDQLAEQVTMTAERTTFNGETMLDGLNSSNGGTTTFHVGANTGDTMSMQLTDGFSMSSMIGVAANGDSQGQVYGDQASGQAAQASARNLTGDTGPFQSLSVMNAADAENAISAIDSMISYVDSQRADLGAMQNRMESTISNQSNIAVNTASAASRIADADYAEEVSNMTAQNILEQAAVAMQTHASKAHKNHALALLQ